MTTPAAPAGPPPIIASMRPDGSRLMLHPAEVRGKWITWRRVVFAVLVLFYVGAPLLQVGGHPAVFLDVEHRKFYLFGNTFNAQDFWMIVLLAITFAFSLLFVTAWRGRVWCGWACPQTVFLEGVFRPLERLIDGPRERRLKAAREPWTVKKLARFALKQALFLAASIAVGHAATALFVTPQALSLMIVEGPAAHPEAFGLSTGFALIVFFNFAWFREQFCVVLCPYGRLQSVLHDKDSITVAYDERRGEPRGHLKTAGQAGDCLDCLKCVHACPTGIDIRQGLQMECLACNQCIDACDEVMVKVKKPKGLIRFLSVHEQAGLPRVVARPRLFIYGAVVALALATLLASLALRTPFESNVLRPRGSNPWTVDGETVRNAFELHLVNKNPEASTFHVSVTSPVPASIVVGTPEVQLGSLLDARVPVSVSIDRRDLRRPVELTVEISDARSGKVKRQEVRFLAPLSPERAHEEHREH